MSIMKDIKQTSKNMNTLLKFRFDNQNISLFLYHSNPTLMAQGPGHAAFYSSFLLCLFKPLINNALEEIKKFNCHMIRTLSSSTLPAGQDDSVLRSATSDMQNMLKLVRNPPVDKRGGRGGGGGVGGVGLV